MARPVFALNHMCAPSLDYRAFFALAAGLRVGGVEIRNDLAGQAILDGTSPEAIREAARERGLRVLSINALQRFNAWTADRAAEAAALIRFAAATGAEALVLVPVNDGTGLADGERQANLQSALSALSPLLRDAGVTGLVEPLGFAQCSLRSKAEAAGAIRSLGSGAPFRLVHDTFHHHLAGEPDLFPDLTGLVHISGVSQADIAVGGMRDGHRVLVDRDDRLGTVAQMRALLQAGYAGPFSFEPFAASVHARPDLAEALAACMDHIETELSRAHRPVRGGEGRDT